MNKYFNAFSKANVPRDEITGHSTEYFLIYYLIQGDLVKCTRCHEIAASKATAYQTSQAFLLKDVHRKNISYKIPSLRKFLDMVFSTWEEGNLSSTIKLEPLDGGILIELGEEWNNYIRLLQLFKLLRIGWKWEGEILSQAIERYGKERSITGISRNYLNLDDQFITKLENSNMQHLLGMYTYVFCNNKLNTVRATSFLSSLNKHYDNTIRCLKGISPRTVH